MTPTKRQLPTHIAAVIAAAKTPAHASSKHVADQLRPIVEATMLVQKQVAEHRHLLLVAQFEHPEHDGHMEHLHQTLGALETDAQHAVAALRRLRSSMMQYERYAHDIETGQHAPFADAPAAK